MLSTFYRFWTRSASVLVLLSTVWMGTELAAVLSSDSLSAQESAAPAADATAEAPAPSEEEVFLANFDPAKSFSKLLLPYVAQRVGLSEEQQTEVTRLMDERAAKLAQAERTQWPTIVTESEAALKAILSPQQLTRFESSLTEKKIVLRFSKERWEDVLKWLAAELGLQLVMDAPPPGTFNYSDKNEYTPKEALDVICGVLQTKGYTLFRDAEVLYLHNFRSGPIPLQFLPKIAPEELPDQSRFDYVALTIPLARRDIGTVLEVIKPFKGPYCTTQVLSGNALMIRDSVNALREILPVALAVYNPPLPPDEITASPTWRDFPLVKTKPTVVRDQVEKFVPSAKPLVNPTSNMISYLAVPSDQEIIDGIIGRLEEGGDPARDLTLGVYPLSDITASSQANLVAYARRLGYSTTSYFVSNGQLSLGTAIAAGFQKLAPEANITLNPLTKQLVVVASPDDQAKIKAAVDQLKAPLTDEEKTLFKTYRFEDPAKTMTSYELTTLRTLIPLGEITFDTVNKTLLVVGTAAEQEKIAQAVSGMNADYLSDENRQIFVVYPMTAKQLTQFNTLFTRLASTPEMKTALPIRDGSVNRLSVWATPRQHEQIKRIVDQISGAYLVEAEKQAVEVPTPQGLPPIEDITSADETPAPAPAPAPTPEKTPEQLAAEKAAAEKAAADKAAADKAAADKAAADKAAADKAAADKAAADKAAADKAAADKAAAEKAAAEKAAAEKAAAEKKAAEDKAAADKAAAEKAAAEKAAAEKAAAEKAAAEKAAADKAAADKAAAEKKAAEDKAAADKAAAEKAAAEKAAAEKAAADKAATPPPAPAKTPEQLAAEKAAAEKAAADKAAADKAAAEKKAAEDKAAAEKAAAEKAAAEKAAAEKAAAEKAAAEKAAAEKAAAEKAAAEKAAAEKAAAEKAAADKAAAEKAAAEKAAAEKAAAEKVAAEKAAAEKAAAEKAAAEKKAAIDAGVQAELAARDAAAEKEDIAVPGMVNGVYLAVIKLEKSYPYSVTTVLSNTIPGIEVTHDPYTKSLVIYGTKSMIAAARRTVERLEKGNELTMEVIPLTNAFPMETLSAIQRIEPAVTVTRDIKRQQLFLFGKPENIARVHAAIESILTKTAPEEQSVYYLDVTKDFPPTTIDFIKRTVPKSEINYDKDNKRFTIFGTPTDQLTVAKLITDAEQNLPAREEVRYYTMEDRISDQLIEKIKEAVVNIPQVKRDTTNPKVLIVRARPVQHDAIAEAIHRIKTELPVKEEKVLAFYPLEKEQYDRFEKLRSDFENENGAIDIVDYTNDRIMVWALSWQHDKLKALIEQIQAGLSAEDAKKVARLYSPKYVDLSTLASVVRDLYSSVTVTADTTNNRLILRGTASKIDQALEALAAVDVKETDGVKRYFAAYDVKSMTSYDKNGTYYSPLYLIRDLQRLVPAAKVSYEVYQQQVIVWGTEEEQQIIKEAVGNLNSETTFNDRFYRHEIRRASPSTLVSMVRQVFPRVTATVDSTSGAVIVQGNNVAMSEVKELLELLDPENPSPLDPTVAVYPFEREPTAAAVSALKQLAPQARIEINKENRSLVVIARPAEQKILADNIKTIEGMMTDPDPVLAFYPYENEPTDAMMATVKQLAPGAKIENLKLDKKLMVTAKPREQKIVSETLALIAENSAPGDPVLKIYPFETKPTSALVDTLKKFAPDAKYELNADRRQLMVIGRPAEIAKIDAQIAAATETLVPIEPVLAIYPLENTPTTLSAYYLQMLVPTARIYPDYANKQMMVIAKPADQKIVSENIGAVAKALTPSDPVLRVYPCDGEPSPTAASYLMRLAPMARVDINKEDRQILVIAREQDQKIIADNIEAIKDNLVVTEPVLVFYSYENEPTDAMMATVKQLAPGAKIENLKLEKKLMVTAKPREQKIVSDTLGILAANSAPGDPILKIYPFENKPTSALVDTLKKFAPDAKYELNADRRQLMVIGRPAEIAKIDAQITAAAETLVPDEPELAIYPLENTPTTLSAYYLQMLVPTARIYPDYANKQMMVIAKPADQKIVSENIGAMAKALTPSDPVLRVYPCDGEPSPMAAYYLMRLAPQARVEINKDERQILVIAREQDQKIIADNIETIKENLSVSEPVLAFYPYENEPTEAMMATVKRLAPGANIENLKLEKKLMVTAKPREQKIVSETLGVLAANSAPGDPVLKIYPFENKPTAKMVELLKKFAPDAQYELDAERNQLTVVARPAEIAKIDAQIEAVAGTLVSTDPVVRAYPLESAPTSTVAYTLMRLAPSAMIYPDYANRSLMVIAKPSDQKIIAESIGAVAKTLSPTDPVLKIYRCENEPTSMTAYSLMRLAPNATVTINRSERSIIVIAQPQDQKIIADNIEAVTTNLGTEPLKLAVYPMENRPTPEVVASLKKLAPTASIDIDAEARQLMVVATAADQKIIAENVAQVAGTLAGRDPVMKVFSFESEPTEQLIESLKKLAPEAEISVDKDERQLMVVAKPREMKIIEENVDGLSKTFGKRDLKMIAYPVYGMNVEELQASLAKVYPDLKVELDTNGSRLLIWATIEEHVKISEEIAQVNRGADGETLLEYAGPQVAVYSASSPSLALQLQRLVKSMFPSAEIFAEASYSYYGASDQKVTILASSREQKLIAAIFEQIKNPLNEEKMTLETFPIGGLDPSAVESTLMNMLENAASASPIEVRNSVPTNPRSYYNRYYGNYGRDGKKTPFFRVDPKTKCVSVFAATDDLDRIREGLEKMVLAAGEEPVSASKVYALVSPIANTLLVPLRQIVPMAKFSVSSPSELIAFGTEEELAKVDQFIKGLEDLDSSETHSRFKSMFLPEGTLYGRDAIVSAMNAHFVYQRGHVYPGAATNQIVLYGTNKVIEKMAAYINEACSATEAESYKTYPISNMPIATAVALLTRLCPNTTVTPNTANGTVTVFGTAFVQKRVADALAEIDAKKTGGAEVTTRYYGLDEIPVTSYYPIYYALLRYLTGQFPTATLIGEPSFYHYIIVAPEQDQEKIAEFFGELKTKRLQTAKRLEVYHLESINYAKAVPILQTAVPTAMIFLGKRPNELFIWTEPESQERVRETLAKLETIEEGGPKGMIPKIYRVDSKIAPTAAAHLTPNVPGAYIYAISMDRILMWGSAADHKLAEELLGVFSEAYPEQVLAKYAFSHMRMIDAYSFLYSKYYPEAILYPSSEGDLMVRAPAALQEKIAAEIKTMDVPRAAEAESYAQAYDISEIPLASQGAAVPNILRIVPDAVFLPTRTAGYFVIYAKPESQKKVADLIAQMIKEQPWLKARTERYTLKNTTLTAAIPLLRSVAPTAQFTPGRERNQLYVWAKASEHERIADALGKLNEESTDGLKTRIYRLDRANLLRAQSTLLSLYPGQLTCLVDSAARTLTVNASAEYQSKVDELLGELDRLDTATQPQVQVFNLAGVNYTSVLIPIRSFYAADPTFQINYDSTYRSLIVRGSPEQLSFVGNLISQIQRGGLADPSLVFKTYTMRNPWSYYTINSVFSRQGRELYMFQDYSTGKLIVMARPEEHVVIENLLDALAPEKTQLAIFDLVYVDPQTAYNIISTMLENDGSFVDVQFDSSSNRLYIRANAKKLEEIRRFLIGAGEKGLEQMPPIQSAEPSEAERSIREKIKIQGDGPLRTIRFEGDIRDILNEVKKNWTRENPLNVIESNGGLIQTETNPDGAAPATTAPVGAPADAAPDAEQKADESARQSEAAEKAAQEREAAEKAAAELKAKEDAARQGESAVNAEAHKQAAEAQQTAEKTATETSVQTEAAAKAAEEKAVQEQGASEAAQAAESPAPAPAESPAPAPAPAPAESAPPEGMSFFGRLRQTVAVAASRTLVPFVWTAALTADGAAVPTAEPAVPNEAVSPTENQSASAPVAEPVSAPASASEPAAQSTPQTAVMTEAAPGVYVVVNEDGTLTITSSDTDALEAFQEELLTTMVRLASGGTGPSAIDVSAAGHNGGIVVSPTTAAVDESREKNIRYLAQQNSEAAREKLVMEDRNYSVYKVEQVSVDLLLTRLTFYMADRINPPRNAFTPSYSAQAKGISMRTISSGPRLTFTPDRVLNTIMVKGSKVDRDEAGAMIAVLDRPELFPQPITKPFKVPVKNTTVQKMATHVLNAFQMKFYSMRLPGGVSPRISPNTETNTLEIYAPEDLANEISDYVKEMDEEILKDPNRKQVQVVKLKQINSTILQRYLNDLRANQPQYNYMTPYMFNPNNYYQQAPRQRRF